MVIIICGVVYVLIYFLYLLTITIPKTLTLKKLIILFVLLPTLSFAQLLTEEDKQMHFVAGAVTSTIVYDYVYRKTDSKKKALVYSIASSILVGTLKEVADSRIPGNRFDTRDLLATTYGGITFSLTFNILTKKKKPLSK